MFYVATDKISLKQKKGIAKRPIRQRTRQTDTCQVPDTSAISNDGVVSRTLRESWRVGGRACWLRKGVAQSMRRAWHKSTFDAPRRKTGGHHQAHSIRATAGSVVHNCGRRPMLHFSNVVNVNLGVKGKTHTRNPGFKMAGDDESKSICLL